VEAKYPAYDSDFNPPCGWSEDATTSFRKGIQVNSHVTRHGSGDAIKDAFASSIKSTNTNRLPVPPTGARENLILYRLIKC
jgi:hypothetical protein